MRYDQIVTTVGHTNRPGHSGPPAPPSRRRPPPPARAQPPAPPNHPPAPPAPARDALPPTAALARDALPGAPRRPARRLPPRPPGSRARPPDGHPARPTAALARTSRHIVTLGPTRPTRTAPRAGCDPSAPGTCRLGALGRPWLHGKACWSPSNGATTPPKSPRRRHARSTPAPMDTSRHSDPTSTLARAGRHGGQAERG
jgi:hypothetical protein